METETGKKKAELRTSRSEVHGGPSKVYGGGCSGEEAAGDEGWLPQYADESGSSPVM